MNKTVTVNHTQNMDIQKVLNVLVINCKHLGLNRLGI